jgi:hypothetical protein
LTTPFIKTVPDTFKEMVAWNDWANGHGDRALDKITCDMLLGFTGLPQENLLKDGVGRHGDNEPDSESKFRPNDVMLGRTGNALTERKPSSDQACYRPVIGRDRAPHLAPSETAGPLGRADTVWRHVQRPQRVEASDEGMPNV